jgi:2'-hydroxyisoflavone reductase
MCGYTAIQVRASAELLRGSVGRYIYISAVAAYGDPTDRPVAEAHPLTRPAPEDLTELGGDGYGRLKATCERIIASIYPESHTILRPQIVTGPRDTSERYSYWVQRAAQSLESGTEMLAPGDGSDHLQVIDVRDIARFARTVAERKVLGTFNLAGPRITWAEFFRLLGVEKPVWVGASILASAGLTEREDLPLFRPERGPRSGLMDIDNRKAMAAGLMLTDPADTLHDTRAWFTGKPFVPALTPEIETELIERAKAMRHGKPVTNA